MLINGSALFTDRQTARKIAAITGGIEAADSGGNTGRDFDVLTSLGAKLRNEAN